MGGSPVQDGVYNLLVFQTQQALTLPPDGASPFGAAVILPQLQDSDDQKAGKYFEISFLKAHLPPQWIIKGLSNGNVTIQRGNGGLYLGYQSDQPRINAFCTGVKNPVEWQLRQGPEQNTFQVVVPGGPLPDGGGEACLDQALVRIFPPPTALMPLNFGGRPSLWRFAKV
ncbi:hypothetical protein M422DRAFT_250151 [Sphaerobolus stellatus SS14]|nr:hypothetical protein M422DRAFT_250151 [Sphaerobolus stellatus SS14]